MAERINPMEELGSTGLERYGGYVYDEFIQDLQQKKGIKIYNQMSKNDPVIGAILFAIQMLIRQVEWRVEPATEDQEDLDSADFLESCLGDMSYSWNDTIQEILSFLTFGWQWSEIVYKLRRGDSRNPSRRSQYEDGKIGWRKIAGRAQTSWEEWVFDDDGGIQALIQRSAPDFITRTIPIEKSLLFRTTINKNNPEGLSLLRNIYRPWYMKKNIEQIQGIGIERDLAGLPVALVPPTLLSKDASASQKTILTEIKKIIRNIRRDEQEGVVFPKVMDENGKELYELKLLSTGGRRQFDTKKIMEYYDQRIAMSVLADFILLGHEQAGSWALSSDKTRMFALAIQAFLDSISTIFNRHAVPRLFRLNGSPIKEFPKLVTGDIETVDLEALGDYVQKLSGSGAALFPDDKLENHLRQAAGMPGKDQDELE
jgi:hypothetical protein